MAETNQSLGIHLILGGARSGKSGYAEQLAKDSQKHVVYIATAQSGDSEMAERIERHQADRPPHWQTIEEPMQLPQVIRAHSQTDSLILVDCLTLWLMNLMHHEKNIEQAVDELIEALHEAKGAVLLVSNEISMGVVPMGALSRHYVDNLGRLHQNIARMANKVTLMVAGIPMAVKA